MWQERLGRDALNALLSEYEPYLLTIMCTDDGLPA